MKRLRFSADRLALAGIGAAISLGAVILSFYVTNLSLSLNILAACGILLPLTKKYYREAILAYVAVSGLGGIFANIHVLSFVLIGGFYTILTVFMHNREPKIKWYIFVFFVVYYLTDILVVNFEALNINIEPAGLLYFLLNLVFTIAFLLYDALLLWGYRYAIPLVEKITKK